MEGYIKLHRQIIESEIFNKPWDWLKIWIYILARVFHKNWNNFKTWESFFNYDIIAVKCGVSYRTVQNCLKWLEGVWQIVRQKQPRGVIIKVINYNKYQDSSITSVRTDVITDVKTGGNSIREECIKNKKNIVNSNIVVAEKSATLKELMFKKINKEFYINKWIPEKVISLEMSKFYNYWVQKNEWWKKEHWQKQKTFDVSRRFATWIWNCKNLQPKKWVWITRI